MGRLGPADEHTHASGRRASNAKHGRKPLSIDAHVGNRLKVRRTLAGMSQTAVGNALGLTFQQIQKYEKGKNRLSAGHLYELARLFGCEPGAFYEGFDSRAGAGDASVDEGLFSPETVKLCKALEALDDKSRKAVLAFARSLMA